MEELKRQVYSIEEAAKLLSVHFMEIHRLVGEGALSKVLAISANSIQDYAARKRITLVEERP